MTAIELKNELHEMIDGLQDEDVLECVHKVVRTFQMKNSVREYIDPVDELNETQQAHVYSNLSNRLRMVRLFQIKYLNNDMQNGLRSSLDR